MTTIVPDRAEWDAISEEIKSKKKKKERTSVKSPIRTFLTRPFRGKAAPAPAPAETAPAETAPAETAPAETAPETAPAPAETAPAPASTEKTFNQDTLMADEKVEAQGSLSRISVGGPEAHETTQTPRNRADESPSAKRSTRPLRRRPHGQHWQPHPSAAGVVDDPFDLVERFVLPQKELFGTALKEIRQGGKRSCWFWFVLPTPPYFVHGVERGSSTNRHYALRGEGCVQAYLQWNRLGVDLRRNYVAILGAIEQQLKSGNTIRTLFGSMDDVKAISSFRMFGRVAKEINDGELSGRCQRVLLLIEKANLTQQRNYNSASAWQAKAAGPTNSRLD